MSEKSVEGRDATPKDKESLSSLRQKANIKRYRNRYWEMAVMKVESKREGTHIH